MKNFKLSTKISLGFSIVLFFLLVISTLSWNVLKSVVSEYGDLENISSINLLLIETRFNGEKYKNTEDEKYFNNIGTLSVEMTSLIKKINSNTSHSLIREKNQDLEKVLNRYKESYDNIKKLNENAQIYQQKIDNTNSIIQQELRNLSSQITKVRNSIFESNNAENIQKISIIETFYNEKITEIYQNMRIGMLTFVDKQTKKAYETAVMHNKTLQNNIVILEEDFEGF